MCRVPRLSDQRLRFFTLTVEFCACSAPATISCRARRSGWGGSVWRASTQVAGRAGQQAPDGPVLQQRVGAFLPLIRYRTVRLLHIRLPTAAAVPRCARGGSMVAGT